MNFKRLMLLVVTMSVCSMTHGMENRIANQDIANHQGEARGGRFSLVSKEDLISELMKKNQQLEMDLTAAQLRDEERCRYVRQLQKSTDELKERADEAILNIGKSKKTLLGISAAVIFIARLFYEQKASNVNQEPLKILLRDCRTSLEADERCLTLMNAIEDTQRLSLKEHMEQYRDLWDLTGGCAESFLQ